MSLICHIENDILFLQVQKENSIKIKRSKPTMDFHILTQEKYLRYFNSNKECSLSEPEMEEFLNDIITLCEVDPPAQSPTKIILNIKDRLECNDNLIHCIHRIVESDFIKYLTEIELFSLLWYVSCRNVLLYEDAIYLKFANNGIIGKIIKRFLT